MKRPGGWHVPSLAAAAVCACTFVTENNYPPPPDPPPEPLPDGCVEGSSEEWIEAHGGNPALADVLAYAADLGFTRPLPQAQACEDGDSSTVALLLTDETETGVLGLMYLVDGEGRLVPFLVHGDVETSRAAIFDRTGGVILDYAQDPDNPTAEKFWGTPPTITPRPALQQVGLDLCASERCSAISLEEFSDELCVAGAVLRFLVAIAPPNPLAAAAALLALLGCVLDLVVEEDLLDDRADRDDDGVCAAADCDDADPSVYPGAPELCDRKTNDCSKCAEQPPICTVSDPSGLCGEAQFERCPAPSAELDVACVGHTPCECEENPQAHGCPIVMWESFGGGASTDCGSCIFGVKDCDASIEGDWGGWTLQSSAFCGASCSDPYLTVGATGGVSIEAAFVVDSDGLGGDSCTVGTGVVVGSMVLAGTELEDHMFVEACPLPPETEDFEGFEVLLCVTGLSSTGGSSILHIGTTDGIKSFDADGCQQVDGSASLTPTPIRAASGTVDAAAVFNLSATRNEDVSGSPCPDRCDSASWTLGSIDVHCEPI